MTSYHRILAVFDRSITDNDLLCDYDIHPWDIMIQKERWSGKIRLIGFSDVFFLICYNGISRFEKGLIIYKDVADLEFLLKESKQGGENQQHEAKDSLSTGNNMSKTQQRRDKTRKLKKDSIYYTVKERGHEIGLKAVYQIQPESEEQKYEIEIRKPNDPIKRRRIKQAIRLQDSLDLIETAARVGFVSGSEITGHALGHVVGGGMLESGGRKFMDGIMSNTRSSNVLLSADQ